MSNVNLFLNKSKGQRVMAPGVSVECSVPSAVARLETRPGAETVLGLVRL